MPYSFVTLSDAVAALARRLADPTMQWWGGGSTAELVSYVQEVLRTWNSLTSFWRQEFSFNPTVNEWWYDIPSLTGSLRPYTVTDQILIQQIAYHLVESVGSTYPLTWSGSNQFALSDLLGAIQRRRDETLSLTGCVVSKQLIPVNFVRRVNLPDTAIDIRRVAYLPTAFTGSPFKNSPLSPSDMMEKQFYDPLYRSAGQDVPQCFLRSAEPPLSFDVDYIPPVPGNFEVLTVDAGSALSSAAATVLGIPDDWSWVVKFGALSELFNRESNAKDPLRAQYCEQRYREGLALLRDAPAVLSIYKNDSEDISVDSLENGDSYNPNWQAEDPGEPNGIYLAGLNLIALSPAPDSTTDYSFVVRVVKNAPVPVNPLDQVQVSRDDFEAILDEAQHLASLKLGGQEFGSTLPLHDRFIKRASYYNSKLTAMGEFKRQMYEISQLNERDNPTYSSAIPPENSNA